MVGGNGAQDAHDTGTEEAADGRRRKVVHRDFIGYPAEGADDDAGGDVPDRNAEYDGKTGGGEQGQDKLCQQKQHVFTPLLILFYCFTDGTFASSASFSEFSRQASEADAADHVPEFEHQAGAGCQGNGGQNGFDHPYQSG